MSRVKFAGSSLEQIAISRKNAQNLITHRREITQIYIAIKTLYRMFSNTTDFLVFVGAMLIQMFEMGSREVVMRDLVHPKHLKIILGTIFDLWEEIDALFNEKNVSTSDPWQGCTPR
ncbi:8664_t:CDS:2 [Ambispora gerdemannii]|uniref:8664_t:CDS:1 n=1 Tax=Ambispora gerdemannii TaxID=144530 RepID=A0A9N9H711_9GLOM|nr:8664_t:CDS:2 [Ambispora gerdemannii]